MPLYEYECDACGHRFEQIQKFSDPPVEKCPKCGSPVHKLLSSPAIQFKGTGWYITDYARKDSGEAKTGKSDAKAEGQSDSKSDTKTESKTESTTTESKPAAKSEPAKPS